MPTRAIKAIFYTRFHHEKGTRVLHQVPAGSITPSLLEVSLDPPLFPFSSLTSYLIPTQQFCDRLLTFCSNHHRIIGYPVCIREGKYSRNEFIFNFAVVVGESERDWACYGEVVRKLGRLLRGLEEQGGVLSREEEVGDVWNDGVEKKMGWEGGSRVYALCEMVLEDLNNYAECMIPIDDSNTINLKLFPTRPPPPPIHTYHVPVLTLSLSSLSSPISSDLTLNRILPYINGVNSISRIASLADTDLSLTRRAVQHLVYYGCLVLLDVFSFGAIYAPTAEISGFVVDDDVKDECARYVQVPRFNIGADLKDKEQDKEKRFGSETNDPSSSSLASETTTSTDANTPAPDAHTIDHTTLITLYTSLRQGLPLKSWILQNLPALQGVDVRRLITFGIIKGFLYRVHKYAVATTSPLPPAPPTSLATSTANLHEDGSGTIKPGFALHRPSSTTLAHSHGVDWAGQQLSAAHPGPDDQGHTENALSLLKFLDGMHCFDEMCTELGLPEKVVEGKVRGLGDGLGVVLIQR
ncbi:nitrogen permease regulator 2 [Ampelomyces quisqualis]|uniref:Nitrogen permease regulator 2 n=1 Tax=Ampelomyces quisqualis TaxID=50730 RepID=A0A6A5QIC2_AMPQU|nr:nitrogen permease regulator 2 [Ampelomyces quisqualis]